MFWTKLDSKVAQATYTCILRIFYIETYIFPSVVEFAHKVWKMHFHNFATPPPTPNEQKVFQNRQLMYFRTNWCIFVFSLWLHEKGSEPSFDQWKFQWPRNSLCQFCILFMLTCKIIMSTCASQIFVKYLTSNLVFRFSYISIFLIYVSMWFLYDLFYANVHDIKLST